MAIDYEEIAADALEAIEEAGQAVMLNIPGTGGGYVPGVGVVPANPATTHEGIGVPLGYKSKDIDGTLIKQGDQRCLVAPQIAAAPKPGHTLTASGTTYNVVAVERVAPAGVPVLYKLQLRGV